MRQRRRRADAAGFTLVEILVAFAIAGVLMTLLLRVLSGGLDSTGRSRAEVSAVLAAQSALDELGRSIPLRDGQELSSDRDRFHIATTVHRYSENVTADTSTLYSVPYEVEVTVSWREGRRDRSISLRSLRLGPQTAE